MVKAKILVVTHKPSIFPKGNCFVPIHAGRAVAKEVSKDGKLKNGDLKWLEQNTIGDDTGKNISEKNRYYNEITAIYWAWKNYNKLGNPDYIGLMHYRRHFVLNEDYFKKRIKKMKNRFFIGFSEIEEETINSKYFKNIKLNDASINSICEKYDVIVTNPADISYSYNFPQTLRGDYIKLPDLEGKDFDLMTKILKIKYPEFQTEIDKYMNGDSKYPFQMFIMRKELFFDYCNFLFDVLFELENEIDFSDYSVLGKRTLGYLGENLLSLFFIIKGNKNISYKHLGITKVKYVTKKEFINAKAKQFFSSIFSVKNKYSQNNKHKVITILGIKIKLKCQNIPESRTGVERE